MIRPVVFLDKDGTLVEDVPYNVDPARLRLTAGAEVGLAQLQDAGYLLIVVSNQSGVARGIFAESALTAVENRLAELFEQCGATLAGFYYCPHHPQGSVPEFAINCACRKPQAGLLLRAAQDHAIDLHRSWMIGDILDDIEAGCRAGCRTMLLDNGGESEWHFGPQRTPDFIVDNLAQAARCITAITASDRGAMTIA